jgi:hypothetical protein
MKAPSIQAFMSTFPLFLKKKDSNVPNSISNIKSLQKDKALREIFGDAHCRTARRRKFK